MSLALSSSETWRYWLRADRPKMETAEPATGNLEPGDPHRPHFVMRHLTGRQQRKLAEALDALEARPEDLASAAYVDLCFAAARLAGIVGYIGENGGSPTPLDGSVEIDDIVGLGYRQARELAYAAFAGAITAGDLGNSDSPSSTAGDLSAKAAPADPAAITA